MCSRAAQPDFIQLAGICLNSFKINIMCATVKLGAIITDIAGSIGGTTFSRSNAGLTVRNKWLPSRSRTSKQSNSSNLQRQLAKIWNELTGEQKAAWDTLAGSYTFHNKVGDEVPATGNIVFMNLNRYLLLTGNSPQSIPNAYSQPDIYIIDEVILNATGNIFTVELQSDVTGMYILFFSSSCVPASRKSNSRINQTMLQGFEIETGVNVFDLSTSFTANRAGLIGNSSLWLSYIIVYPDGSSYSSRVESFYPVAKS